MRCPHCHRDQAVDIIDTSMPTIGSASPPEILKHSRMAPLRICWCPGCLIGFNASPLPDAELAFLYDHYPYISPRRGIGATRYGGLIALVEARCRKDGLLVDIGCSEGYFLEQMGRRGFSRLHGVEPGPQAVEAAGCGFPVHHGYWTPGLFAAGSVDTIVMMHVLEHLPDPAAALVAMREMLAPGGRIAIEVPDFGGFHHQHLVFLSATYLRRVAGTAGLKICDLHADGTVLRVLLAHAGDPVAEAPAHVEDLPDRCARAAARMRGLKEGVERTISEAHGPILWWGAGQASVILLNLCDPRLLGKADLVVVDGDARKCGLGIPGLEQRVRAVAEVAGQAFATLVIASSFAAEISARADQAGIVRERTVVQCP